MKRTNLALEEYSERDLLRHGHGFREVEYNAPDDLLIVDLIELYMEVKYALADESGLVVQFVSATSGPDSEQIAPAADSDPLGAVLAQHVDGNVIVLEAERTRRSAAIRLRQILSRSGRPIVGAVLNNRRNYIPRWLARFL